MNFQLYKHIGVTGLYGICVDLMVDRLPAFGPSPCWVFGGVIFLVFELWWGLVIGLVDVFIDPGETFFEFDDALADISSDFGQPLTEDQDAKNTEYHQLEWADGADQCENGSGQRRRHVSHLITPQAGGSRGIMPVVSAICE